MNGRNVVATFLKIFWIIRRWFHGFYEEDEENKIVWKSWKNTAMVFKLVPEVGRGLNYQLFKRTREFEISRVPENLKEF